MSERKDVVHVFQRKNGVTCNKNVLTEILTDYSGENIVLAENEITFKDSVFKDSPLIFKGPVSILYEHIQVIYFVRGLLYLRIFDPLKSRSYPIRFSITQGGDVVEIFLPDRKMKLFELKVENYVISTLLREKNDSIFGRVHFMTILDGKVFAVNRPRMNILNDCEVFLGILSKERKEINEERHRLHNRLASNPDDIELIREFDMNNDYLKLVDLYRHSLKNKRRVLLYHKSNVYVKIVSRYLRICVPLFFTVLVVGILVLLCYTLNRTV